MRIVYDAALFPSPGGGPRHFVGIANALARQGSELELVLPATTPVDIDSLAGTVRLLRCPSEHRVVRQIQYELQRLLLILRWLSSGRRFDVWMARHSIFGGGLLLARLVARQVVLEVNGPVAEEMRANFGSRWAAFVADTLFRLQVVASDRCLAVTPGLARDVKRRRPRRPVLVLPNAADPIAPGDAGVEKTGLIFVGALTPWYALNTVLRALVILRDRGRTETLTILGDGVARADIEREIRALGLQDQVRILGWVGPEVVSEEIRRARVGVLPLVQKSLSSDVVGSPLKLYEYAAAGLSIVGTRIDGVENSAVSSIVQPYDARDAQGCAEAIEAALQEAPSRLDPSMWSWDARANELLECLRSGET